MRVALVERLDVLGLAIDDHAADATELPGAPDPIWLAFSCAWLEQSVV